MSSRIDETHDGLARSWVESANVPDTDFPIQNLPLGVFVADGNEPRIGVRIGEQVIDVVRLLDARLLRLAHDEEHALRASTLNAWMRLGRASSARLRRVLFECLHADASGMQKEHVAACLIPVERCAMSLPSVIGDFTDFYTSIHHARRASEAIRGTGTVNPNFHSIPIAYHGRASSIAVSGAACHRPYGVMGEDGAYRLTTKLDFELELGFYVGQPAQGKRPISVDEAEAHLFGFCLVNDWSARDIQRWESTPLGPFLAKSFMTTVSPWIVTAEALAPFRVAPAARERDAPPLAAEFVSATHANTGAIDVSLSITLQSRLMRETGSPGCVIGAPNFRDQYWTAAQMLAHHASNGCALQGGDLISSGTVSGPSRADSGCLLERTADGKQPLVLPTKETREYLHDGDTITFTGRCSREGFRSIGFGEGTAEIVGALEA